MEKRFSLPVYSSSKAATATTTTASVIGYPISTPHQSRPSAANDPLPATNLRYNNNKGTKLSCRQTCVVIMAFLAISTVTISIEWLLWKSPPEACPFAVLSARAAAIHGLAGNLVSQDLDMIFLFQNPNNHDDGGTRIVYQLDKVNALAFHGEDDQPISKATALQTLFFNHHATVWIRFANVTAPVNEWVSDDHDEGKSGIFNLRFELKGNLLRGKWDELIPLQVVCRQVKVPFSYNTTRNLDHHFNLHPCKDLKSN